MSLDVRRRAKEVLRVRGLRPRTFLPYYGRQFTTPFQTMNLPCPLQRDLANPYILHAFLFYPQILLTEHADLIKTKTFDGTTLYVPHRLPDEALNLVSTNPYDNSKVKITVSEAKPFDAKACYPYFYLIKHISLRLINENTVANNLSIA